MNKNISAIELIGDSCNCWVDSTFNDALLIKYDQIIMFNYLEIDSSWHCLDGDLIDKPFWFLKGDTMYLFELNNSVHPPTKRITSVIPFNLLNDSTMKFGRQILFKKEPKDLGFSCR